MIDVRIKLILSLFGESKFSRWILSILIYSHRFFFLLFGMFKNFHYDNLNVFLFKKKYNPAAEHILIFIFNFNLHNAYSFHPRRLKVRASISLFVSRNLRKNRILFPSIFSLIGASATQLG